MRSYQNARKVLGIIELFGWCAIAAGVLLSVVGWDAAGATDLSFGAGSSLVEEISSALPSIAIALLGVLTVVQCKSGRASFDAAEYGQQTLEITRQSLEATRQALQQDNMAASPSFTTARQSNGSEPLPSDEDPSATVNATEADGEMLTAQDAETIEYKGVKIFVGSGVYQCDGIRFEKLENAKAYVDQFGASLRARYNRGLPIEALTETLMYRGVEVIKKDNRFLVGDHTFESQHAAQEYVDRTQD